MDDVVKESQLKVFALMRRINRLERDTTLTIFVICSPQFLVKNSQFCSTIIKASAKRILCLVVVDKVHPYVQHGSTFRADIRQLKDDLFAKNISPTDERYDTGFVCIFCSDSFVCSDRPGRSPITF